MRIVYRDIGCIAMFLGIVFLFFSPVLLGNRPIPSDALVGLYHPWRDVFSAESPRGVPFKNFLITDPVRQQIPWRKIAIDQWKQGEVPGWNPYDFSGVPLRANIQAAVFYPVNVVFMALSFIDAWTVLIILQPILAGAGMYLFLRHSKVDPEPALLGTIAWSFCGFSIAWLTWGTIVHAGLWLPWSLLFFDRILVSRESRVSSSILWSLLLILSLTLSVLAGHIQVALYSTGIVFFYGLYRLKSTSLKPSSRRRILQVTVLILVLFLLAISIQIIPFVKFLIGTDRAFDVLRYQQEGWFIPWKHIMQFIIPDFFGNPATMNYWGTWNYGELVGYVGVLTIAFSLTAMISVKHQLVRFFSGVLLVCVVLSFSTPLAYIPYVLKIPLLSSLQPTRLIYGIDFSLALLAAFGFQALLKHQTSMIPRVFGVLFGTLSLVYIFLLVAPYVGIDPEIVKNFEISRRNFIFPGFIFVCGALVVFVLAKIIGRNKNENTILSGILSLIIIGIVAFDLVRFGWKFTPFTPEQYFFPTSEILNYLTNQPEKYRVMTTDDRILPPNTTAYYGIESIAGYDPFIHRRYEEFIAASEQENPYVSRPFGFNRIVTPKNIDSPLLPYLNVGYVLSLTDIHSESVALLLQEGETRLYEYISRLPRAYLANTIISVEPNQVLPKLFEANMATTSSRLAVVESDIGSFTNPGSGTVSSITGTDQAVRIEVSVDSPQFLVISTLWTPDTVGVLDGSQVPIHRVNYLFQGIHIPAGVHIVELLQR